MNTLVSSSAVFCVVTENMDFYTFALGYEILQEADTLYIRWFDQLALRERVQEITSYQEQGENLSVTNDEGGFRFLYLNAAVYEKIKENKWLRPDLIKDVSSDNQIQAYFKSLNALS